MERGVSTEIPDSSTIPKLKRVLKRLGRAGGERGGGGGGCKWRGV